MTIDLKLSYQRFVKFIQSRNSNQKENPIYSGTVLDKTKTDLLRFF